jgi:hypothetical protein
MNQRAPADGSNRGMTKSNPSNGTPYRTDISVVQRLTTLIKNVPLDCECRSRLDEALARFATLESRRTARQHVLDARQQRERIEAILFFLKDLDDLTAAESDRGVFVEIAFLFDDIAMIAREGAEAMRRLS